MQNTKILPVGPVACAMITRLSAEEIARYGRKEATIDDKKSMEAQLATLKTSLEARDTEIKATLEKAKAELEKSGTVSAELKAELDKLAGKGNDTLDRIKELEQGIAVLKAGLTRTADGSKTVGEQFTENEEVKEWLENRRGKSVRARFKAVTSATSGAGNAGELIRPDRLPGIIREPDRPFVIRNLMSQGRTTSNSIEYVQEAGFTNNAAPVAEGAQKPESNISFTLQTSPVRTIAHWIQASNQVLDDVPMLQSYIDNRLRYGLALVEEDQLLAGDGTGQNLLGLIPQATPYDSSRDKASDTRIDLVRRAMTQVRLAEYRADAILMHPEDWEEIELTKDTTQAYIWANPASLLGPTLWGRPVVESTALEPGEFMVGAFKLAAEVWDRQDATVDISTEDRDNFIKNMTTIRAEERLALTVYRPEALVYGDFHNLVSPGET